MFERGAQGVSSQSDKRCAQLNSLTSQLKPSLSRFFFLFFFFNLEIRLVITSKKTLKLYILRMLRNIFGIYITIVAAEYKETEQTLYISIFIGVDSISSDRESLWLIGNRNLIRPTPQ